MNVALHPLLARFVEEQVRAGRFRTAEDVVNGALARLQAEAELTTEDLDDLRADLAVGIAEADRGELDPWDAKEIWSEVERRASEARPEGDGKDA